MTNHSDQGKVGGPVGADAPSSAGPPQQSVGTDAAEAAGFGGVAWADEPVDGSSADESDSEAVPNEVGAPAGAEPPPHPEAEAGASDAETRGQPVDSPDGAGEADEPAAEPEQAPEQISVEDLVLDLERVSIERDRYLDASRRIQAEFENYKKAVARREIEARERANESLVNEILPVLDACDGAVANGAVDVEPVRAALVEALSKQGLERIDDESSAFDPARHDAVMHEPADGEDGPLVAEVMRAGYSWKGRVVRPAMVRVRG